MKEFIEKLIGRLEEEKSDLTDWAEDKAFEIGIETAITIVNQLAEEYKEECEYKEKFPKSGNIYFLTSCNNRHNGFLESGKPYCRFCGKKIKIVPYRQKERKNETTRSMENNQRMYE